MHPYAASLGYKQALPNYTKCSQALIRSKNIPHIATPASQRIKYQDRRSTH